MKGILIKTSCSALTFCNNCALTSHFSQCSIKAHFCVNCHVARAIRSHAAGMQKIIYTKERKIDLPCNVTYQQHSPFSCCPHKIAVNTAGKSLFRNRAWMRNEKLWGGWKSSLLLLKYVNSIARPKTFHGKSSEAARQTGRQVDRDRQTGRRTDRQVSRQRDRRIAED